MSNSDAPALLGLFCNNKRKRRSLFADALGTRRLFLVHVYSKENIADLPSRGILNLSKTEQEHAERNTKTLAALRSAGTDVSRWLLEEKKTGGATRRPRDE